MMETQFKEKIIPILAHNYLKLWQSALPFKLLVLDNPLGSFRKSLPDYFPPQQDVEELCAQITKVGVRVDVDAGPGQDRGGDEGQV